MPVTKGFVVVCSRPPIPQRKVNLRALRQDIMPIILIHSASSMQANSNAAVLCRSAYCQKSSGNFMWSLYRGQKDLSLPLNVMGISRVVVLIIRCFLLLSSLPLLLVVRYFCHLIIVILLKQMQRRLANFHLNVFPTLRL